MALFSYEALTIDGKKVSGTLDASSVSSVREQLGRQRLYPIKITQDTSREGIIKRIFTGSVSVKDKILFTKQLAILLKSGIPLLQAVELLIDQFSGKMKTILVSVKDDLKEGLSLADSLAKFPSFEPIYIQLVRAGEASGKLETILERLMDYLERQEEIRKKVSGALQYPMIQLFIAVIVVIVLLTTVIPNMQSLFEGFGGTLPITTRFLLGLSSFFLSYYLYIIIFLILVIIGFRYWKRSASGSYQWDVMKLKLPMVNYITRTSAVVQFCYTLGILLKSGVGLAESLDIVVKIINNRVLADALMKARDKIIKQGKISEYLQQTMLFPPIAIYLLRTGEESGQLDEMLLLVAHNYEVELGTLIDRATGILGPAMLILMAVIVGFIIMSVMGPIMQLGQQFT